MQNQLKNLLKKGEEAVIFWIFANFASFHVFHDFLTHSACPTLSPLLLFS